MEDINLSFDNIYEGSNEYFLLDNGNVLEIYEDTEGRISDWEPREYGCTIYDKDGDELFVGSGFNDEVNMGDYIQDYGRVVMSLGSGEGHWEMEGTAMVGRLMMQDKSLLFEENELTSPSQDEFAMTYKGYILAIGYVSEPEVEDINDRSESDSIYRCDIYTKDGKWEDTYSGYNSVEAMLDGVCSAYGNVSQNLGLHEELKECMRANPEISQKRNDIER